jgi:glycosyltransferase involved in cell wall biosynthesis
VVSPFFSIVVPVYNVEQYLERCLNSIFSQDFSSPYEVIAVDDASTDKSLTILKHYQQSEPRLIVLTHKVNCKLSIARTTGIKASKGEYIMHIDSDDWLFPGALSAIYTSLNKYSSDVLVFNYKRVDSAGSSKLINNIKKELLTSDKKIIAEHFLGACWNKVSKRNMFSDLVYGTVSMNSQEDLIYSFEMLMKANTILAVPDYYYAYFNNDTSITRVTKPEDYLTLQIIVMTEIKKIFQKYHTSYYLQSMVYRYIQKFIFDLFTKMHFWNVTIDSVFLKSLLSEIKNKQLLDLSSISTMQSAISNKWFCLLQEKKYWGLKTAASIYWYGLTVRSK